MQFNFLLQFFFCLKIFIVTSIVSNSIYSNFVLDEQFGINGIIITDFGTSSGTFNRMVPSIHVKSLPDGKTIVVGDVYQDYFDLKNPGCRAMLVRYNVNGSLDETFANNGKLILDLGCDNSFGIDFAVQKDNKILVACRYFDADFSSATIVNANSMSILI